MLFCLSSVCTICQSLEVSVILLLKLAENRHSWQTDWYLWRGRRPCSDSIRSGKSGLLRYWTAVQQSLLWQILLRGEGLGTCGEFWSRRRCLILAGMLLSWSVRQLVTVYLSFKGDRPWVFETGAIAFLWSSHYSMIICTYSNLFILNLNKDANIKQSCYL